MLPLILLLTPALRLPRRHHPPSRPGSAWNDKTAKLQKFDGLFPLYWDAENGKLLMQINRLAKSFSIRCRCRPVSDRIRSVSIAVNWRDAHRELRSDRSRVLMIEPNYRYRALSSDANERRAVEDSFARSVLWDSKSKRTTARPYSSTQPILSER